MNGGFVVSTETHFIIQLHAAATSEIMSPSNPLVSKCSPCLLMITLFGRVNGKTNDPGLFSKLTGTLWEMGTLDKEPAVCLTAALTH